ncbi:MAG: hypothetical protein AAF589_07425 [Planctomycetota bacterium]
MANVASCPQCSLPLGVPEDSAPTAEVRCPACHHVFALNEATAAPLQMAVVVPSSATPAVESQTTGPQTAEPPSAERPPASEPAAQAPPTIETPPRPAPRVLETRSDTEPPAGEPLADTGLEALLDQLRGGLGPSPGADEAPPASEPAPAPTIDAAATDAADFQPSAAGETALDKDGFADAFRRDFLKPIEEAAAAAKQLAAEEDHAPQDQPAAEVPIGPTEQPQPLLQDFVADTETAAARLDTAEPAEPTPIAPETNEFAETVTTASTRGRLGSTLLWGTGITSGIAAGLCLGYGLLVGIDRDRFDSLGLLGEQPAVAQSGATPSDDAPVGSGERPEILANYESPSDGPLDDASTATPGGLEGADQPAPLEPFTPANAMTVSDTTANFAAEEPPEPASFAPPAEEPVAPAASSPEDEPLIAGAPRYGILELENALVGAEEARTELAGHSLAEPNSLALVGRSYAKLCELAQVLSFLDRDGSHPDMMLRRLEATDIFGRLFRHEHSRSDTEQVAIRWLNWGQRPHGGVFFAGIPESKGPAGSVYEYRFRLADQQLVTVITPEPIAAKRFLTAEAIGLVGCVIESPKERVAGYTGDAQQAVWVTRTVALDAPDLP